jgi:late competence protein required for DNA uptake (superfamily II DNA/RNA helicase)
MIIQDPTTAISVLTDLKFIDFETSFSIAQLCSKCLRNAESENIGRDIVIRIQDAWDKLDKNTYSLWNDLCESAGLYPYLEPELLRGSSLLRYEFHSSKYLKGIYLHEEQNQISLDLQAKHTIVLSAPTSFGKSLLIEEIVASHIYSNIVIVQPTLALLDETRKKLQKYKEQYNIVVSTSQRPSEEKGNLFLFTGERVVDYSYFKKVDFFVIDEFYKLSLERDDDRAPILNHAFYKLTKYTNKFYFLGPSVKDIPLDFITKFNLMWCKTDFSTVAVDEIPMIPKGKASKDQEREDLFKLLYKLEEPTLIYCSSPARTMDLASGFVNYLITKNKNENKVLKEKNREIIEWCKNNVHTNWILINALENSIAFHNGALPRHLGSSIVDSFNIGVIKYLFCTSTLIEGVNTSAKNVVLIDKAKGRKKLDYFDYRNIAGRSGRMNTHFIGRVYNFHKEPEELELDVDIPVITQNNAPLELLVQIDENDLKKESATKLSQFNDLEEDKQQLIRTNSGIPIQGQLSVIAIIEANPEYMNTTLNWKGFPEYEQLKSVIRLSWDYLLKPTESKADVHTADQLTFLTSQYARIKSISRLIQTQIDSDFWIKQVPNQQDRINAVSFHILNVARHWFDYKLPRLFTTVSNLQKYVFEKHGLTYGDYSFFAQQLENGFTSSNLAVLMDYDIPQSAISKLSNYISKDLSTAEIFVKLKGLNLKDCGLLSYEMNKIKAIL